MFALNRMYLTKLQYDTLRSMSRAPSTHCRRRGRDLIYYIIGTGEDLRFWKEKLGEI